MYLVSNACRIEERPQVLQGESGPASPRGRQSG